jgi:ABC-type branched-subunit amino acid transport system substrate-binding protein
MRKRMIVLSGIVLSVACLFLVPGGLAKPMAPTLKVSIMAADSGNLYFAGLIQRAAARLAAADLTDSVKVNLDFEDAGDSLYEAKNAVARSKAFNPDVLLMPIESGSAKAVVQLTKSDPMPMIATAPLDDFLGSSSKPWVFRLTSSHSQDVVSLAEMISRDKPASALVVYSDDDYGKEVMKSLAFGLTIRGVPQVQVLGMSDLSAIRKTKPEVLVVASLEQSLGFFDEMRGWLPTVQDLYLVPGNLANYSSYPWAKALSGAKAILPQEATSSEFRTRLASALGRPALLSNPKAPVFALAWHTYQAITLAAQALVDSKSENSEGLRNALLSSKLKGKLRFQASGYLKQVDYTVYRYGALGSYAPAGSFSQN